MSGFRLLVLLAASSVALLGAQARPLVAGLDHVNIAVNDLDAAAARYRALGFALKPGQPHANGIRNWHAKFPDGTEIELITAPESRDALTTKYRTLLAAGDAPAFLALHAPGDNPSSRVTGIPDYIFFGRLNHSPTDKPEHFAHANVATSLIGVWLAGDDFTAEQRLLRASGIAVVRGEVSVPDRQAAAIARVGDAEIVMLPASRQLVPGRPIVGLTVRVQNIETARRTLAAAGITAAQGVRTSSGGSVFAPPSVAHGCWLEFRER